MNKVTTEYLNVLYVIYESKYIFDNKDSILKTQETFF